MAYEIPNFYVGVFPANIDLSAAEGEYFSYQYTGVCVVTANSVQGTGIGGGAVSTPSTTSTPIIGVLQNNPQQGEAASVMVQGVSKVQAGASWNIGALLSCNPSTGQFKVAVTGEYAVAQALEQAQSGDITTVLLIRNGKQ